MSTRLSLSNLALVSALGINGSGSNGALDLIFQSNAGTGFTGGNATVFDIKSSANNTFIVVGDFTHYNGHSAPGIIRIFEDGTIDYSFNPGTGFNGTPLSIFYDSISACYWCVGSYTSYNGSSVPSSLVQINLNGSKGSFNTYYNFGGYTLLQVIATASDLYVSGGIAKLVRIRKSDGSAQATLTTAVSSYSQNSMILSSDNTKIIIAGLLTVNGYTQYAVAVNADTLTVTSGWSAGLPSIAYSVAGISATGQSRTLVGTQNGPRLLVESTGADVSTFSSAITNRNMYAIAPVGGNILNTTFVACDNSYVFEFSQNGHLTPTFDQYRYIFRYGGYAPTMKGIITSSNDGSIFVVGQFTGVTDTFEANTITTSSGILKLKYSLT